LNTTSYSTKTFNAHLFELEPLVSLSSLLDSRLSINDNLYNPPIIAYPVFRFADNYYRLTATCDSDRYTYLKWISYSKAAFERKF
jgi:hypothetical protein